MVNEIYSMTTDTLKSSGDKLLTSNFKGDESNKVEVLLYFIL